MQIAESISPIETITLNEKFIKCYATGDENIDKTTVKSFGEEWKSFHDFSTEELQKVGDRAYFDILKPEMYGKTKIAIDFGCGSGRWTRYIADKFGSIAAVDPSDAIFSASDLLKEKVNVQLYKASISRLPFADNYFDFGFSLGVLHHIPDTKKALADCVKKVKPGGYFLVYLYYSLDNRGMLFRLLFKASNLIRLVVSRLPGRLKRFVCNILAVVVYMPFVFLCRLLKLLGAPASFRRKIPLQIYEDNSFYIIRNDALDRFGTPLEQRFSKKEINDMMKDAGLIDIVFSPREAFWHAVGKKS